MFRTTRKSNRTFTKSSNAKVNRVFHSQDYNYKNYRRQDLSDLQFAENCCSFPKLALHISKKVALISILQAKKSILRPLKWAEIPQCLHISK